MISIKEEMIAEALKNLPHYAKFLGFEMQNGNPYVLLGLRTDYKIENAVELGKLIQALGMRVEEGKKIVNLRNGNEKICWLTLTEDLLKDGAKKLLRLIDFASGSLLKLGGRLKSAKGPDWLEAQLEVLSLLRPKLRDFTLLIDLIGFREIIEKIVGIPDSESINLNERDEVIFTGIDNNQPPDRSVQLDLQNLESIVEPGWEVYIAHHKYFYVERIEGKLIFAKSLQECQLSAGVGASLLDPQGHRLELERKLKPRDLKALALAQRFSVVDGLIQSMVTKPEDVRSLKEYMHSIGYHRFLVAKLESAEAIDNFMQIMPEVDLAMLGRGDILASLGGKNKIRLGEIQRKLKVIKFEHPNFPIIIATGVLKNLSLSGGKLFEQAEMFDADEAFRTFDGVMLQEVTESTIELLVKFVTEILLQPIDLR